MFHEIFVPRKFGAIRYVLLGVYGGVRPANLPGWAELGAHSMLMWSMTYRRRGLCTRFKLSTDYWSFIHRLPVIAADSKTSRKNPVMCIVLNLENIASLGWILNWSSYCFVRSLTKFSPFLLSEVGWHPNSSAIDYVDTMAICIAIFHGFI